MKVNYSEIQTKIKYAYLLLRWCTFIKEKYDHDKNTFIDSCNYTMNLHKGEEYREFRIINDNSNNPPFDNNNNLTLILKPNGYADTLRYTFSLNKNISDILKPIIKSLDIEV